MSPKEWVAREMKWYGGRVVTTRWRIIAALVLGAFAGNLDAGDAPWWAFFGLLTLAVLVISWHDWGLGGAPEP